MKKIETVLGLCIVFIAGMVTCMNLSLLLDTNPSYNANWFKVAGAIIVALCGAVMSQRKSIQ